MNPTLIWGLGTNGRLMIMARRSPINGAPINAIQSYIGETMYDDLGNDADILLIIFLIQSNFHFKNQV